MPLPILPSTTDLRTITERVNPLIKDYNREDTRVPLYALDTGSATAYVIAPIPGIEMYVVGQIFVFKAANANSGTAPTLAVNGLTAGTITYPNGGALVAGDIPANGFVEVVVASTTPTFHLQTRSVLPTIPIANTGATTYLGGDVALNNAANFFNGANTGSLAAGTYLITAKFAFVDTAAGATFTGQIHDGTNAVDSNAVSQGNANFATPLSIGRVVTTVSATTFTQQGKSTQTTSSMLRSNSAASTANLATQITWVRLA